nr:hypothetical protein [uncultured Rhodopila sp.]
MRISLVFLPALLASPAAWAACLPSGAPAGSPGCQPVVTSAQPTDTLLLWRPGLFPASVAQISPGNLPVIPAGGTTPEPLAFWAAQSNSALGFLTGTPNPGPIHNATAGVFTNTQMNDPFTVMTNGTNPTTEFQYTHPGNYSSQALAVGMTIPSTSSVYDATGFASYIANYSAVTSGTGGEFYVRNMVSGAVAYGINPLVTDGNASGNVAATQVGMEWDIGCWNTASTCYGSNLIGVFPNGTPTTAVAYQAAALNAPWGYAFLTGDGTAQIFAEIGTLALAASQNSQPIVFRTYGPSGPVQSCILQAQYAVEGALGTLNLQCGGFVVSGSELVGGALVAAGTVTGGTGVAVQAQAVPATPATGNFIVYMDIADNKLKAKGPGGTVTTLALP